ncbi:hypothetical protein Ancab_010496 [Ancistrocladus abbreviatus]
MAEGKKLKIVMFPWLAFGHMIPFLELSKYLAQKGHHISFVSTPHNIQRLPKIPQHLASMIDLVKLPLPRVENLPEDAEATGDLPYDKVQFLKKAYDDLVVPMTEFLETSSPHWIIYDFSCYWLPPVATKLGIRQAFFSIYDACFLSFIAGPMDSVSPDFQTGNPEDLTVPPKWITFPTNIVFRLHEAKKMIMIAGVNASGVTDFFRAISVMKGCDVIAPRTTVELEGNFLHLLEEIYRKPVLPLGLMPPSMDENEDEDSQTWKIISGWLDKHGERSVVYVAFGSEATQSQQELRDVALGLELSELPFFWVLKKKATLAGGEPVVLPEGFEERTKDRGLVCTSWAPQPKILGHRSIGGFLTHCGLSSVVEALQFGRPLIMLPFFIDQGLIARIMAEMEVGIEIPRDEENGTFTGESIAESLRVVVVDEAGKIYREKAMKESAMFGDRSLHGGYIQKFEEYLINNV